MSEHDGGIVNSSSYSESLGLYVNCTERNGKLIESHFSRKPEHEITDSGVSGKMAEYLDGKREDLSGID